MSKPELKLAFASAEAAKFACEHWHYSGSVPVSKSLRVGAWEAGRFIGVVIFSHGANRNMAPAYGLKITQCCELTRVALRAHRAPVSRIVAIALRMLRQHAPGVQLVVSYADPAEGHHGGIYQAGGWLYDGRVVGNTTAFFDASGKRLHKRNISATGWVSRHGERHRAPTFEELRKVEQPPKHRYLMPLTPELRARLLPRSRPYPKRAAGT